MVLAQRNHLPSLWHLLLSCLHSTHPASQQHIHVHTHINAHWSSAHTWTHGDWQQRQVITSIEPWTCNSYNKCFWARRALRNSSIHPFPLYRVRTEVKRRKWLAHVLFADPYFFRADCDCENRNIEATDRGNSEESKVVRCPLTSG